MKTIGRDAFANHRALEKVTFPEGLEKIYNCFADCSGLREIRCPESVQILDLSKGCSHLALVWAENVVLHDEMDKIKLEKHDNADYLVVVLPKIHMEKFDGAVSKQAACRGYLLHPDLYADDIAEEYIAYAVKQKKKLLEWAFRNDNTDVLQFFMDRKKLTKSAVNKDFLPMAEEVGAEKCVELLKKTFA